jgi:hypothetical protein
MLKSTDKKKLSDQILSEIKRIKLQEFPYCVTCGSRYKLQLSHVFTRSYKSTIFEMDNNFIQCEKCNNLHEVQPLPYIHWVSAHIGHKRFLDLQTKIRELKHWKLWELEELLSKYKDVK